MISGGTSSGDHQFEHFCKQKKNIIERQRHLASTNWNSLSSRKEYVIGCKATSCKPKNIWYRAATSSGDHHFEQSCKPNRIWNRSETSFKPIRIWCGAARHRATTSLIIFASQKRMWYRAATSSGYHQFEQSCKRKRIWYRAVSSSGYHDFEQSYKKKRIGNRAAKSCKPNRIWYRAARYRATITIWAFLHAKKNMISGGNVVGLQPNWAFLHAKKNMKSVGNVL